MIAVLHQTARELGSGLLAPVAGSIDTAPQLNAGVMPTATLPYKFKLPKNKPIRPPRSMDELLATNPYSKVDSEAHTLAAIHR